MAKRYGRNQKRRAKEEAARLTAEKNANFGRAVRAEHSLQHAKEEAFKQFIHQQGMIEMAIQRISHELGRALAPELERHARRILEARRETPMVDFSLPMSPADMTAKYTVIEGQIPSLHYRMQIM